MLAQSLEEGIVPKMLEFSPVSDHESRLGALKAEPALYKELKWSELLAEKMNWDWKASSSLEGQNEYSCGRR